MDTKGNKNAEWYIINTKGIQKNDECMALHDPESFHPSERIRWSLHRWCVLVGILMGWLFHNRKECMTKAMRKKDFKAHWVKCYCASCAKMLQSCLTLFNLMDCSPPGSSIHGILQARILNGMPFLLGSILKLWMETFIYSHLQIWWGPAEGCRNLLNAFLLTSST